MTTSFYGGLIILVLNAKGIFAPYGSETTNPITADGCFQEYRDTQYVCILPFERRTPISEIDCRTFCLAFGSACRGVNYVSRTQRCDLFQPHLAPAFIPVGNYEGTGNAWNGGRISRRRNKRNWNNANGGLSSTSTPTQVELRLERCAAGARLFSPSPGIKFYRNTDVCAQGVTPTTTSTTGTGATTTTTTTTTTTVPGGVCAAGETVGFLETNGVELVGADDTVFPADTQQICQQACRNQMTPTGVPILCLSAELSLLTRECRISSAQLPPQGIGQLGENPNVNYMEIICVTDTLSNQCPGPYVRQPQRALVQQAQSVVDAVGLKDCLEQCIQAEATLGFRCNSGMFFSAEAQLNCVLNVETAATRPGLFRVSDDAVDYFEPDCPTTRQLSDTSSTRSSVNVLPSSLDRWGPWTQCNPKTKISWRFRECPTGNPNSCQKQRRNCLVRARIANRIKSSRVVFHFETPDVSVVSR